MAYQDEYEKWVWGQIVLVSPVKHRNLRLQHDDFQKHMSTFSNAIRRFG